jgi:protein-S-isoprenylcysteine O-methyltransferase Ste14
MGSLHRAINLIIALMLVALGCSGVVYFYFVVTTWSRGLALAASIVALAGLYWLWDEHINAGPRSGEP